METNITTAQAQPITNTLLQGILDELRRSRFDDIWTAHEIADYLKTSLGSVQARVVTHPTFPAPIRLPTTKNGGTRRWIAKEVKAWALKHKSA